MRATLRALLAVLGASALGIALSDILLGGTATAAVFEHLYDVLTGWRGPDSEPWPATMDSELRFYAAMWGAYGIALLAVARDLPRRMNLVPWLAAAFFVGGLGRAMSHTAVGAPHPLFTLLMGIELVTPPVMVGLWWRARRPA
jgi:hypothetical protein